MASVYQYSDDFIRIYAKYFQVERYIQGRNYQKVEDTLKGHKNLHLLGQKELVKVACWHNYTKANQTRCYYNKIVFIIQDDTKPYTEIFQFLEKIKMSHLLSVDLTLTSSYEDVL